MTDLCNARVSRTYSFHPGRCLRRGVVKGPDGKMWCKQHDPEAVEARSKERDARYEKEMAARRANTRAAGIEACLSALEEMRKDGGERWVGAAIIALRDRQKKGEL